MVKEIADNPKHDFSKELANPSGLGLTPINEKAYAEDMKLWKQAQKTDAEPKQLAELDLRKVLDYSKDLEWLKELEKNGTCILGVNVPKDKKVQMTGKNCEFTIVPMTPEEIKKEKAREEFENSPAGKKEREKIHWSIQG